MRPEFPQRILVTGASGFIGGRLLEVLAQLGSCQPRGFVRSTASAWRITRFPLDFVVGDLCDTRTVDRAVQGCNAVVHLAWGDRAVMRRGLENLLRASVKHRVSRFVHISSVAVYGNNPSPESVTEAAPAKPTDNAYGNEKLRQELKIHRYVRRHALPAVILRPPNVYGPYAPFTSNLVSRLRSGSLPLLDDGTNPCNLIYVDNLVQGILLALWKAEALGETFFLTDPQTITWERCLRDHAVLAGTDLPTVASCDLLPPERVRVVRDSIAAVPQVLMSGDLRCVLRRIPVVERVEQLLYRGFQSLPKNTQQRLRIWVNGPVVVMNGRTRASCFSAADPLIAAQKRAVAHSSDKARRLLGYAPPVTYEEGMALTETWLRFARIV